MRVCRLNSMLSACSANVRSQMKLAALQEEAFVAPGYTQPHAGTRTASITAHTTGTVVLNKLAQLGLESR
jgi:hypothetical protein